MTTDLPNVPQSNGLNLQFTIYLHLARGPAERRLPGGFAAHLSELLRAALGQGANPRKPGCSLFVRGAKGEGGGRNKDLRGQEDSVFTRESSHGGGGGGFCGHRRRLLQNETRSKHLQTGPTTKRKKRTSTPFLPPATKHTPLIVTASASSSGQGRDNHRQTNPCCKPFHAAK